MVLLVQVSVINNRGIKWTCLQCCCFDEIFGASLLLMQVIMACDFAIDIVHELWTYRHISMLICCFCYKNTALDFIFWFEAYASFSGQAAHNVW